MNCGIPFRVILETSAQSEESERGADRSLLDSGYRRGGLTSMAANPHFSRRREKTHGELVGKCQRLAGTGDGWRKLRVESAHVRVQSRAAMAW